MKTKTLLVIISILGLSQFTFSQPMMPFKMNPADSLRGEGNLTAAIAEYKKTYNNDPKDKTTVYNLACALSLDQQIDSCFKYLNIAVKLDTSTASLTDPDFLPARDDKRWVGFENNLISMLNIKFKNPYKDIEYAKALWRLNALDQAHFSEIDLAGRKLGFQSTVVRAIWKLKFMINEKNQIELEGLIAKKGWPKNSVVGTQAASAAFYIIQHSDLQKQLKYLPTLKQLCEEKEANWANYALMYDRVQMLQNLPQKYGTQMKLDNAQTGMYELYQLEDETKVNEWRKEIGLKPIDLIGYKNIQKK
jgi:hypothetical protein